jgi:endoglycosylceramidase
MGRARVLAAAAVLVVVGACAAPSEPLVRFPTGAGDVVSTAPPDAVGPIRFREGRMVDAEGRVVLVHGINSVRKSDPFYSPLEDGWLGPADFDLFARSGLNGVRLGVWADALMPEPGVIDQDYLDHVTDTVDAIAAHGMWVLLDFHQDVFSGMPAWATLPAAAGLSTDPPALLEPIGWAASYFSPRSQQQWEDWWANATLPSGRGVVDAFGDGIAAVAERFAGNPNVLGLELLNEPFPSGSQVGNCLAGSCPALDALVTARWTELTNRARAAAPNLPIWWEPIMLSFFTPEQRLSTAGVAPTPATGDRQIGLSFHTYCLGTDGGKPVEPSVGELALCRPVFDAAFDRAGHEAASLGGAPAMLTEFGASASPLNATTPARLADDHLMSWLHWHYPSGATASGLGTEVVETQLVRTYAQATAGTPLSQRYDPATGAFTFRYRPDRSITAPTSIVVPARPYPDGYVVHVSGGSVTSEPNAGRLTVEPDATSTEVTVTVARA